MENKVITLRRDRMSLTLQAKFDDACKVYDKQPKGTAWEWVIDAMLEKIKKEKGNDK
jgi:hypothetical protein